MVRSLGGHLHRVGATAWSGCLVASGSKDKSIFVRDLALLSSNNGKKNLYGA